MSSAPKLRQVHEIFNPYNKSSVNPFPNWFQYIHGNCPPDYLDKVESYVEQEVGTGHICLKDPISVMSIEWLANKLDANVVFCIRHPAAFAGSLKVAGWKHQFENFLNQPELMERFPSNYRDLVREYVQRKRDIVDQAILLWNIIYDQINVYRDLNRLDWHFVRHEDLSRNPTENFKQLFEKLGLTFAEKSQQFIDKTTNAKGYASNARNSLENIHTWKKRLTPEEIERVKSGTESVWRLYYNDDDWA